MVSRRRRSSSLPKNPTQIPIMFRRPRSASVVETVEFTNATSAEKLSRVMMRQVRSELRMQNVDVRGFTTQHLQACLPVETNTEDHLNIFKSFMKEPLLVPDSDLQSILRYKPSLKGDPRIKYGTFCYYRSWPMTREQLQDILASLAEQNFFSKRTQHWTNICRIARPGQVITIRYIGKTAHPSSPYQRFHEDLRKGNGSLFFRLFLSTLKSVHPRAYANGCPYLLSDSIIKWFSTEGRHKLDFIGDKYERFFVCFFKSYALLNQQSGGSSIDFVPPIEDESLFYKCRTSIVTKFQMLPHPCSSRMRDSVRTYFQEITNWIETPGSIYRDRTIKVNARYLDALCYQGTAQVISGQNVFAFCGLGISSTSFNRGLGFFEGQSKSSNMIRDTLEHLIDWEQRDEACTFKRMEPLFAFNNLFNWSPAPIKDIWIASVGDQERILSIITDLYLHMDPRLGVSQALVEFDTSLDSCDVGSPFFWDCEFEFSWAKPLGQQRVSTPKSSTLLGILKNTAVIWTMWVELDSFTSWTRKSSRTNP